MGTKNNPAPNDCYSRALPNEETFTLLGRDAAAPATIRFWALERVKQGKNKPTDAIIIEAYDCADRMEQQHGEIRREMREIAEVARTL